MCVNEAVGTGEGTKVDFILKIKNKQTNLSICLHTNYICVTSIIFYYITNIGESIVMY